MILPQFSILIPEISVTAIAILMQFFAVFYKKNTRLIVSITVNLLFILGLYLSYINTPNDTSFNNGFEVSSTTSFFKLITLFLSIASIVLYSGLNKISNSEIKFEFVTLMLLSTTGIFISISARDLLVLFCGLELQALSGYALAAFNRNDIKSSEAGLKYFILGGLISCLILFGMSFLYGYSGSIKFSEIHKALSGTGSISIIVGVVFLITGILFKLSSAPLHIWTPGRV